MKMYYFFPLLLENQNFIKRFFVPIVSFRIKISWLDGFATALERVKLQPLYVKFFNNILLRNLNVNFSYKIPILLNVYDEVQ